MNFINPIFGQWKIEYMKLQKKLYDGSEKKWECGYYKNNTLAAYAHVHFFGNMDFIKDIVNYNSGGKL